MPHVRHRDERTFRNPAHTHTHTPQITKFLRYSCAHYSNSTLLVSLPLAPNRNKVCALPQIRANLRNTSAAMFAAKGDENELVYRFYGRDSRDYTATFQHYS